MRQNSFAFASYVCVFLLFGARCHAGKYQAEIVDIDSIQSPLRAVIGIPQSDTKQNTYRRNRVAEIVTRHVNETNSKFDSGTKKNKLTLQFAFIAPNHQNFARIFPLHGEGSELTLPAIRLRNSLTGDFMYPNWKILLIEFEEELGRLVDEFETWVSQSSQIDLDSDNVMVLHEKNLQTALLNYDTLLVNFYAPWCAHSKAMAPTVGSTARLLGELRSQGLPVNVGVGKVNVDLSTELKETHNIKSYPTLKIIQLDRTATTPDAPPLSTPYPGPTDTASALTAHLVSTLDAYHQLHVIDAHAAAGRFLGLVTAMDGLQHDDDNSAPLPPIVVSTAKNEAMSKEIAELLLSGSAVVFVAATKNTTNAEMVLKGIDESYDTSRHVSTIENKIFVRSPVNGGILETEVSGRDGESLARWVMGAIWPTISRFDPSSSQGDIIRSGVIGGLMLLVADEKDFLHSDWLGALEVTADAHRGEAHFLYANEDEPRIGPILQLASVTSFPAVVLISLLREFPPQTVVGGAHINAANLGTLLVNARRFNEEL